ncbi:kinase-like protein [Piedraia hortae CBS 480.64]|uniref:non-specific serine/threonine protein kinase n=1 Tax=Piedraia hortae CBS 480.64 TaxID=1314780 RepID=A0A6A7BQH4_9PEZI|nr:kinase-like protein [Piedraia hortae CBS 480.64]
MAEQEQPARNHTNEMENMQESMGPLDESGATISDDEEEEEIDDAVAEDIRAFKATFKDIDQRYRLISRIGEGTFSTVYKAEDLLYDYYRNDWDIDQDSSKQSHYVAIKKIYVTSSPIRIMNELELLHDLRNSDNVCPLITAFRHQDQVIAVLPFFRHRDFRDYYRDFTIDEMRVYFYNLFTALRSVHEAGIIHRDIKPTNFLYSPSRQHGVLVDFGLAERDGAEYAHCLCCASEHDRLRKVQSSVYLTGASSSAAARPSYPNNDTRPSRRANRAGTRGFRAPEVLLKCTAQSCLIDVWSCGVILLTFLTKRFPFFHSADDIDAFIELCCIFGKQKMKETALLHGQVLQTNIPTLPEKSHGWDKIVLWCTDRDRKTQSLSSEEQEAVGFLSKCLELNPSKRLNADDALHDPFIEACLSGESGGSL